MISAKDYHKSGLEYYKYREDFNSLRDFFDSENVGKQVVPPVKLSIWQDIYENRSKGWLEVDNLTPNEVYSLKFYIENGTVKVKKSELKIEESDTVEERWIPGYDEPIMMVVKKNYKKERWVLSWTPF